MACACVYVCEYAARLKLKCACSVSCRVTITTYVCVKLHIFC